MALSVIRNNALNADKVNWTQVDAQALTLGNSAQTTVDTYPLIRSMITQLGDHQSVFRAPGETFEGSDMFTRNAGYHSVNVHEGKALVYLVSAGSEAAKAGLQPGDTIVKRTVLPDSTVQIDWRRAANGRVSSITLPTIKVTTWQPPQIQNLGAGIVRLSVYTDLPASSEKDLVNYAQQLQTLIGKGQH